VPALAHGAILFDERSSGGALKLSLVARMGESCGRGATDVFSLSGRAVVNATSRLHPRCGTSCSMLNPLLCLASLCTAMLLAAWGKRFQKPEVRKPLARQAK
jgi:hypothetical protein